MKSIQCVIGIGDNDEIPAGCWGGGVSKTKLPRTTHRFVDW